MDKNKHFTLADRTAIEEMLGKKKRFSDIARLLGKDPTTISKEIQKHKQLVRNGKPGKSYNNCQKQNTCKRSGICTICNAPRRHTYCRYCTICNKQCHEYVPTVCEHRLKPPYVCNGCGFRFDCNLEKYMYVAVKAHEEYLNTLSQTRSGIAMSEMELDSIDHLVSPLIKQNQSPHHVCATNRDSILVSERTLYRLLDANLISARNIDLPRKVRFKPRKKKKLFKVDKACRIDRDYACFKKYIKEFPDTPIVQLDSVEGKKGSKVLLTIHFVNCEMMLAFLRDSNTAKSVADVIDTLHECLGLERFQSLFPLLLADNGSEFSNPSQLEFNGDHVRRCRVFYCDPNAPYQKGSAERNHEFIRCFIPKGVDMSGYTQEDITLMMNHINSYCRASLGNKAPYEVFRFLYGSELLEMLGCTTIPAQQVTLNKTVFKKEEVSK